MMEVCEDSCVEGFFLLGFAKEMAVNHKMNLFISEIVVEVVIHIVFLYSSA